MSSSATLCVSLADGEPSELAHALAAAAERVRTDHPDAAQSAAAAEAARRPCLTLRAPGGRTVRYLAAPEGPEAAPFAEIVARLASPPDAGAVAAVDLTVFVAAGCPHCPRAVRAAGALAAAAPGATLTVVDAAAFPALAARWNVRSVPLTVLDDELALTGLHPSVEIAAAVARRGTAEHERAVLASLTEHGRFAAAGARLERSEAVVAFAELWTGAAMERRIGLLLALEAAPPGGGWRDRLVRAVEPAAGEGDARLRGDTAELLARLGGPTARTVLERLAADPDPDVAEAAQDALDEIG